MANLDPRLAVGRELGPVRGDGRVEDLPEELVQTLINAASVRIEGIISHGHAWVIVIRDGAFCWGPQASVRPTSARIAIPPIC